MATACITGASSGIGREFALQLSRIGYDLILISRNAKALNQLASSLPTKCQVIICDLSNEDDCLALTDRLKTFNLRILINNAGFGDFGQFSKSNPQTLKKDLDMINVNIKALHIITKELLPGFIKRNEGYILNVASSAGLMPGGPYMATYYATKAYVTSLTSAIYQELKASGSRVHISMLCPGPVNTNFNDVAGVFFPLAGISASYCVSYAIKQMFKEKLTIVPTFTMKLVSICSRLLPRTFMVAMTARQQKKKK